MYNSSDLFLNFSQLVVSASGKSVEGVREAAGARLSFASLADDGQTGMYVRRRADRLECIYEIGSSLLHESAAAI
jgi:hypothetical protein